MIAAHLADIPRTRGEGDQQKLHQMTWFFRALKETLVVVQCKNFLLCTVNLGPNE